MQQADVKMIEMFESVHPRLSGPDIQLIPVAMGGRVVG
jgi:hypothetical protein